ncbi:helix-turn-helix transcriptional regulator [Cohnella rhizosphaerae]|uniref:AraC family transcriptional regulator n=1 Tax=Cohnella rhizosphaerae TaxID=1457232 RepID=A0A9X4KYB1_9BACL|nr:AraC family transcriptional regulator [Cohnella rhizosphaerae]MDG0813450.1 AraC family transcriptional regulator [Cohnella rhizosphaerae]
MLVWLQQPLAADKGEVAEEEIGGIAQLKGMLELVLEMCEETFGISVHFIVDSHAVSWDQIAKRYSVLRAASGSLPVVGGRGSIAEYPFANAARTAAGESELLETIMRHVKRLDLLGSFLDTGRKDEFLSLLEELLLSAEKAQACHLTHAALGIYFPLSLLVQSHIHTWNMEERLNGAPDVYIQALHHPAAAPNRTSEAFRHIAPLLFEWRQNAQTSHAHTAIAQVQEYLLSHLDGDLSLVRLAEVSRLNPSYLSRLFKQVTGVNLNVYIQEARMNKAIELLRESDFKVYEIARIAGFEYAPYFTKTFKKHFGFSPQEYRDRMASDVNRI